VTGDFNIAPDDIDVWDPEALVGSTHVSAPEREVLSDLCAWGLTDIYRDQHPEPKLFSWWDYRDGGFHKNHGMRIDLLLVSDSVAKRTKMTVVDRNARKGEKPSDHAPVVMEL
jgi:exodeoxyribonuclease-3